MGDHELLPAGALIAPHVLGLSVDEPRPDGALPLRFDDRDFRILLSDGARDDIACLGREVADGTALEAMMDRLARPGVPLQAGSAAEVAARGVREMIVLEDPDGVRTVICHGPGCAPHAFHSNRIGSGLKTGAMGLGRVLIDVRDCATVERFYRDVLGFRLSDYINTEFMGMPLHAAFLHVNPRHHSLAFASLGGSKRLHHVMPEVNALDDVGATLYRAQDLGVPIALSLGRHPNDRMISFTESRPPAS